MIYNIYFSINRLQYRIIKFDQTFDEEWFAILVFVLFLASFIQKAIYIKTKLKSIIPSNINGDFGPILSKRYPASKE